MATLRGDIARIPWLVTRTPAVWLPSLIVGAAALVFGTSGGTLSGSGYLLFNLCVFPPQVLPTFLAGLLASRASYIAGALVGLVAWLVFSAYLFVGPVGGVPLTVGQRQAYVLFGLLTSPIAGLLIGALGGGLRWIVSRGLRRTLAMATGRFCPSCGSPADAAAKFCPNCGSALFAASPSQPEPPPTTAAVVPREVDWGGIITIVAGSLAILGSFLPWITATAAFVGTISRSGIDGGGDGVLTIVLGIVIALFGIARVARSGSARVARIGTLICAVVLGWIAVTDYGDVQNRIQNVTSSNAIASVGMGLIVVGLAVVLAVVGAWFPERFSRREQGA